MSTLQTTINDQQLQLTVRNMKQRMQPGPLLRIAGQRMRSSEVQTFRDQGVPAGSWAPLATRTRRRGRGGAGRKTLIQSGRLMSSVTDDSKYVISGNELMIGSNLIYARIQQEGGYAGRRTPSKRTLTKEIRKEMQGIHGPRNQHGYFQFRRPFIPARPYLVFRPEDPEKIAQAMERYIASIDSAK